MPVSFIWRSSVKVFCIIVMSLFSGSCEGYGCSHVTEEVLIALLCIVVESALIRGEDRLGRYRCF